MHVPVVVVVLVVVLVPVLLVVRVLVVLLPQLQKPWTAPCIQSAFHSPPLLEQQDDTL